MTLPLARGDTADGHVPTFEETVAFGRRAEAAGLDSIWVFDHLLFRFPEKPEEGVREAWTTLAALAAVVPRVELGSLVMCASFRNPALLAKMAATRTMRRAWTPMPTASRISSMSLPSSA